MDAEKIKLKEYEWKNVSELVCESARLIILSASF